MMNEKQRAAVVDAVLHMDELPHAKELAKRLSMPA